MSAQSPLKSKSLPLFPLPEIVLCPGAELPLHIFEKRYRLMIAELIQGDGTFGVINWNPFSRVSFAVGCAAKIVTVQKFPDGRFNILTRGQERFRVKAISSEKPYISALVEWFSDEENEQDLSLLAATVKDSLLNVIRLSSRLADKHVSFPADLPCDPVEISFWAASSFSGLAAEQQLMLEMTSTEARLLRQQELLGIICKNLVARVAIEDAFKADVDSIS